MLVYKIMSSEDWADFQRTGTFSGALIDLKDGYIHFSTAEQAKETAAKHFSGQIDLVLVDADADDLGPELKWEVSRGGARFPHLYRNWMIKEARTAFRLEWDGQKHLFPDGFS